MIELSHVRTLARNLVDNIVLEDPLPLICLEDEKISQLENPTDVEELCRSLQQYSTSDQVEIHVSIVWAEALLRNPKGVLRTPAVLNSALIIHGWAAHSILPTSVFAKRGTGSETQRDLSKLCKKRFRLMSEAGLRTLSTLHNLFHELLHDPGPQLLACYVAFLDDRDEWSSIPSRELSMKLLQQHTSIGNPVLNSHAKVASILLDAVIRPEFASAKNDTVTEQGRKAIKPSAAMPDPGGRHPTDAPWKYHKPYITTLLEWSISNLDINNIEPMWPRIIPPLLILVDDEAISNKIRGCKILTLLLTKISPDFLQRTGLGDVFTDSLLPLLSYLPPLTEEVESIRLMNSVFETMRCLTNMRFMGSSLGNKVAVLDQILRVGIIDGYAHAGDNIRVAELLLGQAAKIVDEMEIYCVKHLKDIVPILSGVLSDPFILYHMPLLQTSIGTLQAVLRNGWPRIDYYKSEILRSLALCWCRLNAEIEVERWNLKNIEQLLQETVSLLIAALGNEVGASDKVKKVLASTPALKGMLNRD